MIWDSECDSQAITTQLKLKSLHITSLSEIYDAYCCTHMLTWPLLCNFVKYSEIFLPVVKWCKKIVCIWMYMLYFLIQLWYWKLFSNYQCLFFPQKYQLTVSYWFNTVSNILLTIGSGNDLLPVQCQAITWTNTGLLSFGPPCTTSVLPKVFWAPVLRTSGSWNLPVRMEGSLVRNFNNYYVLLIHVFDGCSNRFHPCDH